MQLKDRLQLHLLHFLCPVLPSTPFLPFSQMLPQIDSWRSLAGAVRNECSVKDVFYQCSPSFCRSFCEVLNSVHIWGKQCLPNSGPQVISELLPGSLWVWPSCFWICNLFSRRIKIVCRCMKVENGKCLSIFLHAYASSHPPQNFLFFPPTVKNSLFSWKWKQNRIRVLMVVGYCIH